MLKATVAGRVGRDAELRQAGDTDVCSFSVATDVGFGRNKSTLWLDVSKFGKGAEGLVQYVRKGDPITVTGDLSTREHNGKTYLQLRADDVALQGAGGDRGERKQSSGGVDETGGASNRREQSNYDDLDSDSIPF